MNILQPVIALAAWTMIMSLWMYATRLPAMSKAGVKPDSLSDDPDMTLDKALPPRIQWVAHNYNHLHEAPTVFYAVALALALVDAGDGLAALLGWVYVALRVVHSLIQATINRVVPRFVVFFASQTIVLALISLAVLAVF